MYGSDNTVIHPVENLGVLRIIEAVKAADQIPGDPADAVKGNGIVCIRCIYKLPIDLERNVSDDAVGMLRTKHTDVFLRFTLLVVVMPGWRFDPYSWPYETVVYADVRYNGEPLSGNMMVGAFVGNECRAIGEVKEWNGVRYTQFRIGSELFNYSEPGEDEVYASETIRFMLYDPATHLMREHPETLTFDGEAHGTLSNLYQLYF